MAPAITLYSSSITSSIKVETECRRMRDLLEAKRKRIPFEYEFVDIALQPERKEQMVATGIRIVPVLVIDGQGYNFEAVQELNECEELDGLLAGPAA